MDKEKILNKVEGNEKIIKYALIGIVLITIIFGSILVYNIISEPKNADITYSVSLNANSTNVNTTEDVEFSVKISDYDGSNINSLEIDYGNNVSHINSYNEDLDYTFETKYDTSGEYTAKINVKHDSGYTSTDSITIDVVDATEPPKCEEYTFEEGNGSVDNPYIVGDIYDFQCIGENGHYLLDSDIDASPSQNWDRSEYTFRYDGFEPIGKSVSVYDSDTGELKPEQSKEGFEFNGTIDGDGYTVSNLKLDSRTSNGVAPIDTINENGIVKNLKFDNHTVYGHGGVVVDNHGTISNVEVYGIVDATSYTMDERVGGIASQNTGLIEDSHTDTVVSGDKSIGGIVGWVQAGSIENSVADGTTNGEEFVGEIIGLDSR